MLVRKLPFPLYTAVIVWVPTDRDEVLVLAMPLPSNATAEPKLDPPSLNCTVPAGVPPEDVTVAVKVTDWPETDGFCEELTDVDVVALPTVKVPVAVLVPPPVPVTVKVVTPTGEPVVVIVSVDDVPPEVTGSGLNEPDAPEGNPEILRSTSS